MALARDYVTSDSLLPRWSSLLPPGGSLVGTLEGHVRSVNAVALLPDGSCAVSGSWDSTLKLWDLESGAVLRTFEGHAGPVNAVAILPDGSWALSAPWIAPLNFGTWRAVPSYAPSKTMPARSTPSRYYPTAAATSPGSSDGTLKLWDLRSGVRSCAPSNSGSVPAVALLAGGRRALSGSRDQTLKLWDLENGVILRSLDGRAGSVTAVALLSDGTPALSASGDRLYQALGSAEQRRATRPRGPFQLGQCRHSDERRQPRPLRFLGQHPQDLGPGEWRRRDAA